MLVQIDLKLRFFYLFIVNQSQKTFRLFFELLKIEKVQIEAPIKVAIANGNKHQKCGLVEV